MKIPALPSRLLFVLNVAIEVFIYVSLAVLLIRTFRWWGALIVVLVWAARWMFLPQPVQETDQCAKCHHQNADHHGNCQECLRASVRGDVDRLDVPCSKFKRGEAPTPWRNRRSHSIAA